MPGAPRWHLGACWNLGCGGEDGSARFAHSGERHARPLWLAPRDPWPQSWRWHGHVAWLALAQQRSLSGLKGLSLSLSLARARARALSPTMIMMSFIFVLSELKTDCFKMDNPSVYCPCLVLRCWMAARCAFQGHSTASASASAASSLLLSYWSPSVSTWFSCFCFENSLLPTPHSSW